MTYLNLTFLFRWSKISEVLVPHIGINMGTLTVLRNETQLWTRTGDQGKSWQMAEINIGTSTRPYKVYQHPLICFEFTNI